MIMGYLINFFAKIFARLKTIAYLCTHNRNSKNMMQLNEKLLKELPRILNMTNGAISEKSNIAISTWYRIVQTPSKISVHQLIDLANGLHIPVSRFFSSEYSDEIGKREDYIVCDNFKDCYYNGEAIQKVVKSGVVSSYKDAATTVGVHPNRVKESLLAVHRLPVTRLLNFCNAFTLNFFEFIVDPNLETDSGVLDSRLGMPLLSKPYKHNLAEEYLIEMQRLRAQYLNTQSELDAMRRNQNNNNDMEKKVIKAPVTWFFGIRFLYAYKDMSEPVRAWFQMLVKKERPHETFFFAKTGNEYNTICFYTDDGIKFFEAGCQSPLSDCLFREKIMVGKIQANVLENNTSAIEFKADLVANAREDRKDTADCALFKKEMTKKFG